MERRDTTGLQGSWKASGSLLSEQNKYIIAFIMSTDVCEVGRG